MALEWLVLGRAARGEEVVSGYISDSWHVKRDGHLIWADGFRVSDEVFTQLTERHCSPTGRLLERLCISDLVLMRG